MNKINTLVAAFKPYTIPNLLSRPASEFCLLADRILLTHNKPLYGFVVDAIQVQSRSCTSQQQLLLKMGGDILPEEQLSASLRFAANTILFLIFLIFVIPYTIKYKY